MADADFNINIRTIADTTGIKLTQQGLDALKIAALQGNQQAIAALQQLSNAQKSVAAAGAGNAAELGRLVGTFTGVGIAGGVLALVNGLKQASAEIVKIADELDKQGEMLVKHAQLQSEAARHAKDQDDVLKISSATLKDIESTQKTFNDLSAKELNAAEKLSDYLQVQMLARQRMAGIGDYEAAHRAELETAASQAQSARERAMREVLDAEKALNRTAEEQIEIIERQIKEEEKRKKTAEENNDPFGYVKAANDLAKLKNELAAFIILEKEHQKIIEKKEAAAKVAAEKATASEKKAATLSGKPGGEEAAQQAEKDRAEAQRQEAELREQKRAEARKKSDRAEVAKYGRVLDPAERASETIKEREELGQKAGQAQEAERQKAFADQMEAQTRGITQEQLKNEREAKGVKPTDEKDTSQGIITAIEKLNEKFDRYWQ